MAFCKTCGARLLSDDQRFCHECGTPTDAPTPEPVAVSVPMPPAYPASFKRDRSDIEALASGVYAGPMAYSRPDADCRLVYAGPPIQQQPVQQPVQEPVQQPPAQEMLMTYAGPPAPVYAGPQQMGGMGGFMGFGIPAPTPTPTDEGEGE